MGIDANGYYTLRDILGYNERFNIVLSDRGRGKTYGTKRFLWEQPGEFMCVYRQKPDMTAAINSWLDPLQRMGYDLSTVTWEGNDSDGYQLIQDDRIKGYFRTLSAVNRVKQETFPDTLDWMWWDEFIPMAWKKLPGIESEGDALRTIYKTIDHDTDHPRESRGYKPLRVLMYGNPRTWDNPILSYFNVDPLKGIGIHRAGKDAVCEILAPLDRNEDEVDRNMAFLSQGSFCSPIPKGARPVLSIRISSEFYTFYEIHGSTWVKKRREHTPIQSRRSGMLIQFGTLDGLREEERCLEDTQYPDKLRRMLYRGMLQFENMNTKFDFMRAMETVKR